MRLQTGSKIQTEKGYEFLVIEDRHSDTNFEYILLHTETLATVDHFETLQSIEYYFKDDGYLAYRYGDVVQIIQPTTDEKGKRL